MSTFFNKLLTRMAPVTPPADPEAERDERDAFALRVKSVLEAVGIAAEYDPVEFSLRMGRDKVGWLDNRFDEYQRAAEEDREEVVLHVARSLFEVNRPSPVSDDIEIARISLRPRIRQRAHLAISGMQVEAEGIDPESVLSTSVPISTDLAAEIVYDTPTHIVSVSAERLALWGIGPAEALAVAVDNLKTSASSPFRRATDGVWFAAAGDCYDSARILLVEEICALPLDGAPVALPANRDLLAVTGANNLGGLYRLLQVAMSALERPRMDTLQPVVFDGDHWKDWLPERDHPLREPFYELAVRTRGTSYAELQGLLSSRHKRLGVDTFIASYGVFCPSDGAPPRSHALWPPLRGYLPETDLVSVLHPEDDRYVVVPRRALMTLAGHLLRRVPDLHPPYDAFEGPPSADLWEQLKAHAIRQGTMSR